MLDLAQALPGGDRLRLSELFRDSYQGARDLYQISAPAMEAMLQAMLAVPGVIGARQAGAGFGGCMVGLVEEGQLAAFAGQVQNDYAQRTGIQPQVYPVIASPGAGLLG